MKTPPWIIVLLLAGSALAGGCASAPQEHYYWGSYEGLILKMYTEPGSVDPVTQIERLNTDLQQAESKGKPAPPGLYAHLGFMYAMNGDVAQAEAAFKAERDRFPEASVFIDGMMARARANREASNAAAE
jgi:hypothetical protein